MTEVNRVWRLRKRPVGEIADDVLSLAEEPIPEPRDGECLFRLNYLSLDPTNRIWMSDIPQYMPPVELDAPMRGIVCGTVVRSRHPNYAAGQIVSGLGTWADYQIGTPAAVNPMGDTGPMSAARRVQHVRRRRSDRLFRPPRHRATEERRNCRRLRRRRRRGLDCRPDRED